MKENEVVKTEKQTTFDRILRFMNESDIVLTSKEEEILARWSFAHKQNLQRKFTEQQIIEKICYAFKVSEFTARNDIYQAHALYGGSIKSNKKYLLHHHAESIMIFLERCKTDKSLVHLVPKLMDAYTKAVIALPDELNKDKTPPPMLFFGVIHGQEVQPTKTPEDALRSILKRQNKTEDHTDFEIMPDAA